MFHISLAKRIYDVMTDEKYYSEKCSWIEECKNTKMILLWRILFETDVDNKELLESRIYEYGSKLKENDYVGREIFVCLVAFLNLVIK